MPSEGSSSDAQCPCGGVCHECDPSPCDDCSRGCRTAADELSRETQEQGFAAPEALRRQYLEAIRYAVNPQGPWGPEEDAAATAAMAVRDEQMERLERSREGWIEFTRVATEDAKNQRHRARSAEAAHRATWEKYGDRGERIFELQGEKAGLRERAEQAEAANARVRGVIEAIDADMRMEPDTQRAAMQLEAITRFSAALNDKETRVPDTD